MIGLRYRYVGKFASNSSALKPFLLSVRVNGESCLKRPSHYSSVTLQLLSFGPLTRHLLLPICPKHSSYSMITLTSLCSDNRQPLNTLHLPIKYSTARLKGTLFTQ